MLNGYTTHLPDDCLLDAGVLYYSKAGTQTLLGVTDGAPDFDPGVTFDDITFDGKRCRVKGLSRKTDFMPVLKGTAKEFGPAASGNQLALLEPGESEAIAGGVTTVTTSSAGSLLASGSYVTDLRWICARANGGYAAIYFPVAKVRKWTMKGQDKKEAAIAFEFEAVGDPVNDLSTAPYAIEIRTVLPTNVVFRYNPGDSLAGDTFTRASTATYYDVNGIVQSISTGVQRDGHFVSGTRTLLLESQRTNLILQSGAVANAAWSVNAVTATAAAGTAPDGTTTAVRVAETTATDVHVVFQSVGTVTNGNTTVWSIFAKAAERTWLLVRYLDRAATAHASFVNLSTGAVGTLDASMAIKVEALGAGWYRVDTTLNNNGASPGSLTLEAGPAQADNVASYAGNASDGILLWGGGAEGDKAYATSYIPTTASTVTRSADSLSIPGITTVAASTLFTRAWDLATAAWIDAASAYTSGTAIVPAVDKAYQVIAVVSGTLTAAQCAAALGVP